MINITALSYVIMIVSVLVITNAITADIAYHRGFEACRKDALDALNRIINTLMPKKEGKHGQDYNPTVK